MNWVGAWASCEPIKPPAPPLSPQTYDAREGYNPQPPDLSGVTLSRELQVSLLALNLGTWRCLWREENIL